MNQGTIQLEINGKAHRVAAGTVLLRAIHEAGFELPTLCARPGLAPPGGCRLCSVQVAGEARPVSACNTPCHDGMRVETATPEIEEARRQIVEMLLAGHPVPCRTEHDVRGPCELETLARQLGLIPEPVQKAADTSHPAIAVWLAACVGCGGCIQACADVQGHHVIGWHGMGELRHLSFSGQLRLADSQCVACGQCVDACPTGALAPHGTEYAVTGQVATICPYCGVGCGITCHVGDGKIRQVTTEITRPANHGRLCVKGRFGLDYAQSGERLVTPLIRKDGVAGKTGIEGFREASWDEALDMVAGRLAAISREHGGGAVGGLGSAKCTNEDNYLFQKWLRAGLLSHNVDHCARLCHSPSVAAMNHMLGSGAATGRNTDFLHADAIFLIGTNTLESHPVIATFIREAKARGTRLVVADPRRVGLAAEADIHLAHRPGTDTWLINALCREVLGAGLINRKFISRHTDGFEMVREALLAFDMDEAARVTGLQLADIRAAARLMGKAGNLTIAWAMGITQHVAGTFNCAMLGNLALMTGNLGRPGAGLMPLRGQNNVQGASDMGVLPNVFPGYQPVSDKAAREKFERAWGRTLPDRPGMTVVEMFQSALAGQLRAMHIMGENPALSDPDLAHVHEALERLEFLVVQDVFFTETCAFADVILPAASILERDGSVTNTERRMQRVRPVLAPPGMAWADGDILQALLAREGFAPLSPAEALEEMARLTPLFGGVTLDRLEADGILWPCPTPGHPGTPVLHVEGPMRGKARFIAPRVVPPAERESREFPYLLTTGRLLVHYQTGTLSRRSEVLEHLVPGPWVEIHPDTLAKAGGKDGQMIEVRSPRGSVRLVARALDAALPGVVFIPFHFREAAVNHLVHDQLDPEAKIPEYKCVPVALIPVS